MKNTKTKQKILLLAFLALLNPALQAQGFDINWSEPTLADNKLDGWFSSFIGTNSSNTYVKYSNLALKPSKADHKIAIKGLDPATMKEKFSKVIVDFKDPKDKEQYRNLDYYKTVVFDNIIYVFWKSETREADELWVRTFDTKMKQTNKLKKIYEIKKESGKGMKQPELFVLYNIKAGDNLIIGGELGAANGQVIKVEYKLMKSDLSFVQSKQVDLPISKMGRSYDGFSSTYEYGEDGKLFIYSVITPTREERKQLKKDGNVLSGYYDIISAVDLNTGNISSYTLKFDKKFIQSYKAMVDNNSIKVTGFYTDLDRDKKGADYHGIFYVMLGDKDMKPVSVKFSNFTSQQVSEIFAGDREGKDAAGIFSSKKKKKSEAESISSLYNIEKIVKGTNGDLLLFGSRMYNYTVQYCTTSSNGVTSCTYRPYCQKDNVTAFRISAQGDLMWAKNIDRRKTYYGWNRYDLNVAAYNDKYYVIYGSDYQTKATKKNNRSAKKGNQSIDKLEYAIFDGKKGDAVKQEETINKINAKKEEKKYIDPTNIYVMNNSFYIPSQRRKYKPGRLALDIAASIVCFPVGIVLFMSPNNYKATTYIGKLSPK
jgi:hypothetical protein